MLDKRGSKILNALGRFTLKIDKLSLFLEKPFRWNLFFIMSFICLEVIMRYVFHMPWVWGLDVRSQIYGGNLMIAAGYCLIVRGHITVDILMVALPLAKARLLEFWNYVLFFFPTVMAVCITGWIAAVRGWRLHEHAKTTYSPPIYPFQTVLAIGYVILLITGISEAVKDLITYRNGDEEWLKER